MSFKKPSTKRGAGKNLKYWDTVTAVSLVFVCFVTPYEVAFYTVEDGTDKTSLLYWANRLVDCVFFLDLVLQFFIAFPKKTSRGVKFVYERKSIACHYLKSWFLFDFLTVMPFDTIAVVVIAYQNKGNEAAGNAAAERKAEEETSCKFVVVVTLGGGGSVPAPTRSRIPGCSGCNYHSSAGPSDLDSK